MRYIPIILILVIASCKSPESAPTREELLQSTTDYLWSQQAEDGGWHSETHGILKGGKAWTPYVLFYLMQSPDASNHSTEIAKALEFIRASIGESGAVGITDDIVLEYPNYATSYAFRVLQLNNDSADSTLLATMQRYLQSQQFGTDRGLERSHPAFGSWGFGETGLADGQHGHVDLSHTRRVVQALQGRLSSESTLAAERFLSLLQKQPDDNRPLPPGNVTSDTTIFDGGFYASTTVFGTNKAGMSAKNGADYFASYATTTCDGILTLLALGVTLDDPRLVAATRWLEQHPQLDRPEGIPVDVVGGWEKVLFFYHLSVRSEVYQALDWPGTWREEMLALVAERQRSDGSFANPFGAPNKEDDPLLASAMVVGTLLSGLD